MNGLPLRSTDFLQHMESLHSIAMRRGQPRGGAGYSSTRALQAAQDDDIFEHRYNRYRRAIRAQETNQRQG